MAPGRNLEALTDGECFEVSRIEDCDVLMGDFKQVLAAAGKAAAK
ncbi:MAG TPA: hypothetical protein VFN89_12220 [Solirubrobacterales bacterium]|nr:hypothetical protein [Solirubrobacterales bacterium]